VAPRAHRRDSSHAPGAGVAAGTWGAGSEPLPAGAARACTRSDHHLDWMVQAGSRAPGRGPARAGWNSRSGAEGTGQGSADGAVRAVGRPGRAGGAPGDGRAAMGHRAEQSSQRAAPAVHSLRRQRDLDHGGGRGGEATQPGHHRPAFPRSTGPPPGAAPRRAGRREGASTRLRLYALTPEGKLLASRARRAKL